MSSPIPQTHERHVNLEIIGWSGAGKAAVGRVVAEALRSHHAHVEILAANTEKDLNFWDGEPIPGGDLEGQGVTIWLVEPV